MHYTPILLLFCRFLQMRLVLRTTGRMFFAACYSRSVLLPLSVQLMSKHTRQGKVIVLQRLFYPCSARVLPSYDEGLFSETVDFRLHNNGTKRWAANSCSLPQGVEAGRGDAK